MASVTAYITCADAAEAIDFYARAFGAVEQYRIAMEEGRIGHAELQIGDTILMLSDEAPEYGAIAPTTLNGTSCALVLEVDDVDTAFERALGAGATEDRPITEEPYGRGGWLTDPFGHRWNVMRPDPDFDPAKL